MSEPTAPPGYTTTDSGLLMPVDYRAAHFTGVTNSQTPDPWLVDWWQGSRRSHAGIRVSPQGSMALAAYYACLNVIAQDCAKLPLPVLRNLERGSEKVRTHRLWRILQQVFNEEMTAYIGRYVMTHHAVGWGNGYGLILRDRSMTRTEGQVTGIYPLHPARVWPQRDRDTGEIVYRVYAGGIFQRDNRTVPDTVPAADMLHLKGPSGDGLVGYSVAQIAAENLGLSLAAQEYGASFFGNGGAPSGILKHPNALSEVAQKHLKESFIEAAQGAGIPVLEQGLDWIPYSIPPEQAQFIATRMHGDLDICRWFRMSPIKIGILDNAHFNNVEQFNISHVVDTMMPWYQTWEQELWMKLLQDEDDLYVRHDTRALLRGDAAARANYYKALFMVGAYSPNDILELEDMNPFDGGDERFLQIQMAPIRKIVDGTAQQPRGVPRPAPRPMSPSDQTAHVNGHQHGQHALVED